MIRVIHILPALSIGGVEIGVQKSWPALRTRFDYEVFSIKGAGSAAIPHIPPLALVHKLFSRHRRPDVVVTSLWPSHILGWALQLFGVRWIPFFHAASREGAPRDQILAWAARRARLHLCDSQATADYYGLKGPAVFICPYLFRNAAVLPDKAPRPFAFVYCGRLSPEKRPDLILDLLEEAKLRWPGRRSLLVVGADPDTLTEYTVEAERRGLDLTIRANVPHAEIAGLFQSAEFCLDLSDYEGFSMTTVEALQNGCLPVVRPVGEIPNYLPRDAGVYIDRPYKAGFADAVDQCRQLSDSPDRRAQMISRALAELDRYDDYVSAFSRAIGEAMEAAR